MKIQSILRSALLVLILAGTAGVGLAEELANPVQPAEPASWIFGRSYYSHDPVAYVEVGRRGTLGGPEYPRGWGAYVRSGYSYQQGVIRSGGRVMEWNRSWDSYFQAGARN